MTYESKDISLIPQPANHTATARSLILDHVILGYPHVNRKGDQSFRDERFVLWSRDGSIRVSLV